MDKIEVGEYVRTKKGNIDKIDRYIFESNIYHCENGMCIDTENRIGLHLEDIVKHSKNKFELLESEDIVILEYYVRKYGRRIKRRFEVFKVGNLISFKNAHCDFLYDITKKEFLDGKGYNPNIKKIVTKELFESVEYEI